MGVIYKLMPEVKEFILMQKKDNPTISCRGIAPLIEEKFRVKLSKSSINAIFKESGLSMPVGRRLKKKKEPKPERLLLAVKSAAEALIGYTPDVEPPAPAIVEGPVISAIRCVKVDFSEGNSIYLDGKMYTVWPSPQMPGDFSSTICDTDSYINEHFANDSPIILFSAPGYGIITPEFFNFASALDGETNFLTKLSLLDGELIEQKSIPLIKQKYSFITAIWPWQHVAFRKIKKIGEFRSFVPEQSKANFYIADTELDITQPNTNQALTLRGCALKTNLTEKTRLIIVTNLSSQLSDIEGLANAYFSRWPTPLETFQEFNRKTELFLYVETTHRHSHK